MMSGLSQRISQYDNSNMLELILQFPEQIEEAITIGKKADLEQPSDKITRVIVAGMGGSAIGGNILQKLFTASGTVPCDVIRDYRIPAWANQGTLVLISSYSGNTEETLSAYKSAISQGCFCIICTSGGEVIDIAKREGHPVIKIPGGSPPRTALGYLIIPLLVNFMKWNWIKSSFWDHDELSDTLRSIAQENDPTQENDDSQSVKIAQLCENRVPVFYSSSEIEVVGMRWKGQMCENSKVLAYHNSFPEMNHNEIVGWQRAAKMGLHQKLCAIFLRDQADHDRIKKRMDIVRELIGQSKTPVVEVHSQGETLITRLFSLIYLADFVSFRLAMLNGEDPTPIKNIDYLKSSLANT